MAIRGKIFVAVLLALTLVALTSAFAGDREKLGDANWTGPLSTPNPNTLPKNSFYGETYFIVTQPTTAPHSNTYESLTEFVYGITNRLNLQILPDFYGTQGGTGGVSTPGMNVGALIFRVPYQIYKYKEGSPWPSFTIAGRVNTPVGTGSSVVDPTLPAATLASKASLLNVNTNVWTPGFGLWVQRPFWMPTGRILRVRAAENFFFPLSKTFTGASGAAVCGTSVSTSCNLEKGNYVYTQLGMEYSLTKHWVPAFDFTMTNHPGTKTVNNTLVTSAKGSGSQVLTVDPALEYNFTGNVGVIFGAEISIAGTTKGEGYIAPQIALQWFKQ
jgi:hypothetical protein